MFTLATPITIAQAREIAFEFLADEWELSVDDRDWFSVLSCRLIGEAWYVVEIGIEGLPDKWIFQVFDTGYCDPSYTFVSPIQKTESDTGLEEMPERIAEIVQSERLHN